MQRALLATAFLACAALPAFADFVGKPLFRFHENSIYVRTTTGSDIWLFGSDVELRDGVTFISHREASGTDDNLDGWVEFELDGAEVPPLSTYFAYSPGDGAWSIGTGGVGLGRLVEVPFPFAVFEPSGFESRVSLDLIELPWAFARVAVVRSNSAMWTLQVRDGSASDSDGEIDGVATIRLADMVQQAGDQTAVPIALEAGDLIVALNRDTYQIAVHRLTTTDLVERRIGR
ncbi:MAG: hypothetical protein AAGN46_06020 [Acidobacteriota bacterium]